MKSAIFIPARRGSTRLPNKPLVKILGETLIYRVWKIAKSVKNADSVIVTTDCKEIQKHCESFGATVILTSTECVSGTDRIAQALKKYKNSLDLIFNLQGDTPLTPPHVIEEVITVMQNDRDIVMATPMRALLGKELENFVSHKSTGNLTGTTVVFDKNKNALYFSKGIIPNFRDSSKRSVLYQHIGLYGYRTETLERMQSLEPSNLELIEGLEQLRALENNIPIRMVEINLREKSYWSVDQSEDIRIVEEIIKNEGEVI